MTHIDWPMLLWCGGGGTFGALLYVLAQAFYGMWDDWRDSRSRMRLEPKNRLKYYSGLLRKIKG